MLQVIIITAYYVLGYFCFWLFVPSYYDFCLLCFKLMLILAIVFQVVVFTDYCVFWLVYFRLSVDFIGPSGGDIQYATWSPVENTVVSLQFI